MSYWLRQSTGGTIPLGPFVGTADGYTAGTALTISQAEVRLSKNGAAFAQVNGTANLAHMENGYYALPLDATDTNTLGRLRVAVNESAALPVWQDFMIVPSQVWDSFFATDALQVHAVEIANDLITAASIATGAIDADAIADNAIDAAAIATGAITAAKFAAGAIDAAAIADNAIDAGAIAADAITAAKIADGAIDAATFAAGAITAAAIATGAVDADALAADAVAEIADGVWDEATLGHTTGGTFGEQAKTDIDAILADTGTDGVVVASIAAGAITAAAIATGAIDADAIADNAIDAGAIAAGAITAAKIATDAIDADALAADAVAEILTTAMTEAYAAEGGTLTIAQALHEIVQFLTEKTVASTTVTVKKRDGSTTAATYTLNDASTPTAITRGT